MKWIAMKCISRNQFMCLVCVWIIYIKSMDGMVVNRSRCWIYVHKKLCASHFQWWVRSNLNTTKYWLNNFDIKKKNILHAQIRIYAIVQIDIYKRMEIGDVNTAIFSFFLFYWYWNFCCRFLVVSRIYMHFQCKKKLQTEKLLVNFFSEFQFCCNFVISISNFKCRMWLTHVHTNFQR